MKKPDYYRYIAIFKFYEGGISITFPDLEGCVSNAETEGEAIQAAKDVLRLHLFGMEEEKIDIPDASSLSSIKHEKDETPVLIEVFMTSFREKQHSHFIKKTLSIPSWLNAEAEHCGINFSQVLREALENRLNIN